MEQRGERLLASQERKAAAISELAAALKEDHDGWEAERELWAKEKEAVEARLSSEEKQVAKLKQEVKRLARGVHVGKQDKERLARESEGLRQENRKLAARNEKLEARNLEVRRQIETLVKRNKRLQATMARELLSSSNNNIDDDNNLGGDNQAPVRTRMETSGSGSGQAEVVSNIVIPSADRPSVADRSSVSDAAGRGESSRRPRGDQCSDADEVTTPKDTTTAGRGGPPAGRGRSKAKRGDGAAWGWPVPSGTTDPMRAQRMGARRRPRRGSVDGFNSEPKDNAAAEAGAGARARAKAVGGEWVTVKSERMTANIRGEFGGHNGSDGGGDGGAGGDGSGGGVNGSTRAPLAVVRPGPASKDYFVAVNLVKKRPRNHHNSSSRSGSSSSTGSTSSGGGGTGDGSGGRGDGGGGEARMKVRSGTRDAQREGGSAPLGRVPPVSSVHRAIAPAISDKRMPTASPRPSSSPSSSSSSFSSAALNAPLERKRARLSLGTEDGKPAGGGPVVEVIEVLEQRRVRGGRSATGNANPPPQERPRKVCFTSPAVAKEEEGEGGERGSEEGTNGVNVGAVKAGDQPRESSSATGAGVRRGAEGEAGARVGGGAEAGVRAGARARAKNVSSVIQTLLEAVPLPGKDEARFSFEDAPTTPPPAGRPVDDERPGLKQAVAENNRVQARRGSGEQPRGVSGRDAEGGAAANTPMHTFEPKSGRSERSGFDDADGSFREDSRRRDEPLRASNGDNRASMREVTEKKGGTEQGGRCGGVGGAGWENDILSPRVTAPAAVSGAIYPQLAMATVKSPKKSKPSRRRQQQQQWQDQHQFSEQDRHQYPERDQDQGQSRDQGQQFHDAERRPVAAGGAGAYPCSRGSEEEKEEEVTDHSEYIRRGDGGATVGEGGRLKYAKPPRHNLPLPSERTSRGGDGNGASPKQRNGTRVGLCVVDIRGKGIGSMGKGGSSGGGVVIAESGKLADGGGEGNAHPRGSAEAPPAALWKGGTAEGGGGESETGGGGEGRGRGRGRGGGEAGGGVANESRGMLAAAARRQGVENPYREGNGGEGEGSGGERETWRGGGGGGRGEGAGGREGRRGGGGGGGEYEQRSPKKYKYQEVVRDRFKRAAMKGHDCEHCEAYLAAVGGSPGERQAMMNVCSRHKHTEANGRPAETPDGFWDLSFADSVSSNKELDFLGRRHNGGGGGAGAGKKLADGDSQIDF